MASWIAHRRFCTASNRPWMISAAQLDYNQSRRLVYKHEFRAHSCGVVVSRQPIGGGGGDHCECGRDAIELCRFHNSAAFFWQSCLEGDFVLPLKRSENYYTTPTVFFALELLSQFVSGNCLQLHFWH